MWTDVERCFYPGVLSSTQCGIETGHSVACNLGKDGTYLLFDAE